MIVTWCRPRSVQICLDHLRRCHPQPYQILVVDASPDDLTAETVAAFPQVGYLWFPAGAGAMTASRNFSLLHVTGDIIAFIDDDAYPRPGWVRGLSDAYLDSDISAVAGRTCNGQPGEEVQGLDAIGQMLPNGNLTGNFAAQPRALIDVDHGIGANMSFRRDVLAELGGFRDDFRGVGGVREDSDIFLRIRALGYRVVFSPTAVVDHVGAPHARGTRFDYRYFFWLRHNHALLVARNFGLASREYRGWALGEVGRVRRSRSQSHARRAARLGIALSGVLAGTVTSVRKARLGPTDPIRRDSRGKEIRHYLGPVRGGASSSM